MTLIKKITLLFCFAICLLQIHAQVPSGSGNMGNRGGNQQNMNMGHFYGKIVDSTTNKAIEAASVQLFQFKLDSVTKKRKEVLVDGMLTNKKGEFSIENLPVMTAYTLKITAIGFKTFTQKVAFNLNMGAAKSGDFSSMLSGVDKDLGNIKLEIDAKQLQEVTIVDNKPLLTMAIDRKIFNVERNINSVGGTAIDVMKNVPGLNVDIDGAVTMRNATPQIFVDGRPTTMTLEQIPADAIATVEIITNPSAKFDASGGGAGILNVVLKKNRKAGYNGNIRSGIDSRGKPTFGADINIKQQKINFFASGNIFFRKSITTVETDRTDYLRNATANLTQYNGPIGTGAFGFGRLGFDYFIDNRNTITISGNMSRGKFENNDFININRDTIYASGNATSDYGNRTTNNESKNKNYGTSISFKHNFAKANKSISADANYNYNKNDNTGNFGTQYFNTDNSIKTPLNIEQTVSGGTSKFFTSQVDYSNPINDKIKIETGARIAIREFYSFNFNYAKDATTGNFIRRSNLDNEYKYTDRVLAAYATFAQQIKKFNYQLGLRIESSKYDGTLISKNQLFKNEFPLSFFPSAFATYKINDKQDVQLNYSRKINRPNFFQLIPFIDYSDSLNLSKGNPDLIPEFTNLLELSYQNQIATGHNILATIYYKNTTNLITRYQYQLANPNAPAKPDTVVITDYANATRSFSYGVELTVKNKIANWWEVNTNFNFFNATLQASNISGGVSNNQYSWFVKMNNNFNLPKNYSIQLSGDYQAKTLVAPGGSGGGGGGRGGGGGMFFGGGNTPSAQGYIKPQYGVDIALKKSFLKNNAASLTLQMSDIFRTKINGVVSQSVFFTQDVDRRRDPQVLRLNFNWRFGKLDATLFKRKNTRVESDSMQGMN